MYRRDRITDASAVSVSDVVYYTQTLFNTKNRATRVRKWKEEKEGKRRRKEEEEDF